MYKASLPHLVEILDLLNTRQKAEIPTYDLTLFIPLLKGEEEGEFVKSFYPTYFTKLSKLHTLDLEMCPKGGKCEEWLDYQTGMKLSLR